MRKVFAVAALAVMALLGIPGVAQAHGNEGKWFVCKYVGAPFVDERLQTGQNPISVDGSAIEEDPVEVGSYFQDQHGRSYVLAADYGQEEPDVSECPPPTEPTTTTNEQTTTTTAPETTTTVVDTTTTAPETTSTEPGTTPTTETPTTSPPVGGVSQRATPGELAFTGSSTGTLAWFGGLLVALGLALALSTRKAKGAHDE